MAGMVASHALLLLMLLPVLTDEHQSLLSREVALALLSLAVISAVLLLALAAIAHGVFATCWLLASLPALIWRKIRARR